MEDKRSQARNRPPELATNGLRDKPTLVNNVETLAWAPAISCAMRDNRRGMRSRVGRASGGRRLLSISGELERPGVYEIPIGTTLGDLINMAGGVRGKRSLGGRAPSGPSGGLIPPTLPAADGWQDRLKGKSPELAAAIREGIRVGGGRFDARHLPLDLLQFREVGPVLGLRISLMLGAGLAVYSSTVNAIDQAINFTRSSATSHAENACPAGSARRS